MKSYIEALCTTNLRIHMDVDFERGQYIYDVCKWILRRVVHEAPMYDFIH